MDRGVLFYVTGEKPLPELVVAYHSLRHHNPDINVHFTLGPVIPTWFVAYLKKTNISYNVIEDYYHKSRTNTVTKSFVWCQKPYVIAKSPFRHTLYYDCDHMFLGKIDPQIWMHIEKYSLVTGMGEGRIPSRRNFLVWRDAFNSLFIPPYSPLSKSHLSSYWRVNGGCIGVDTHKQERILGWIKTMNTILNSNITNRRVFVSGDEVGLSMYLNAVRNVAGGGWTEDRYSYNYHPYDDVVTEFPKDAVAIHLSRSQYQANDIRRHIWTAFWREAMRKNTLGVKDLFRQYSSCNGVVASILG